MNSIKGKQGRISVSALTDGELAAVIVEHSTNPAASTLEMIEDSYRLNISMFKEKGHAKWREFTEKLALAQLGEVPDWEPMKGISTA